MILMGNNFFNTGFDNDLDRVDGKAKVTGTAKFAAEHQLPNMSYGVLVASTIGKGHIRSLDTGAAERSPGVLAVLSHMNRPKVPGFEPIDKKADPAAREWEGLKVFYSDEIFFNGQPIALVVADSFERALYAASLVKAQYIKEEHQTDFLQNKNTATPPQGRGSSVYKRGEAGAYKTAPVQIEAEFSTPIEVHNPMEPHAIIAAWEAEDKVTVYDKTQGPKDTQNDITQAFGLPKENVKAIAEFVGGAFGSALRTWPHEIAAVMAAKKVGRPVKLVIDRTQMFTMVGYRPQTFQKLGIGATADGKLIGISHTAIGQTSSYEQFTEGIVNVSKFLYACPNVTTEYKLARLDLSTPIWMRGPGEATGAFALESALDELSYKLKLDPIEVRLRNYPETDPEKNLPWSSNYVKDCYALGAERIGWYQRNPVPRSMNENGWLAGYGVGCGVFGAFRWEATVRGVVRSDGSLVLQSAVSDMGPGTATAMTQIAAEAMALSPKKIKFELGDSSLPPGPTQGGSGTTSTLGTAVHATCTSLKKKLAELVSNNPVFHTENIHNVKMEDLVFENGFIALKADPSKKISYTEILKQNNLPQLEVTESTKGSELMRKYSAYSYSVHFVKLLVHPLTGVVKIIRVVTAADAGKIVSPKTAESQIIGGVVGGIGMALMEEGVIDHRYGRWVNNNFADYHVPVHADVPHIEAVFVNKPDPVLNPMGAKGMGEIALIGFAAAVANAVYHATGKRIRELPITPDKLI
jgi:xanthine dehydrogenase YagR molybdenum-binding subunit